MESTDERRFCGIGVSLCDQLKPVGGEVAEVDESVSVMPMSRRSLSYSIDNLLATKTAAAHRDAENLHQPPASAAAALRLHHEASQQRMYI